MNISGIYSCAYNSNPKLRQLQGQNKINTITENLLWNLLVYFTFLPKEKDLLWENNLRNTAQGLEVGI